VANLADEIAYYSHDLDDGLDAGLLSEKTLQRETRVWRNAAAAVRRKHGVLPDECRRYFTIRCIIDDQVRDVVESTEKRLENSAVECADDVRRQSRALVRYSDERRKLNQELRDYLYANLYFNPVVHEPNKRAVKMLEELFHHLTGHHEEVGDQSRKRARKTGWPRAICDYLAGMTDRYVMLEHQRLLETHK
jgi:dGTPase